MLSRKKCQFDSFCINLFFYTCHSRVPFLSNIPVMVPTILDESQVEISVYNLGGKIMAKLVKGIISKGPHQVIWNGTDSSGKRVPEGIYLYQMQVGNFTVSDKMCLLR